MSTLLGTAGVENRGVKKALLHFVLFILIALVPEHVEAQSFSCPIGKQASCLDYSDKVCSSFSKCVDQSAVCFDSYQCDYNGFTCKSNVLDLAKKHDALVDDYNRLIKTSRALSVDYDDLLDKSRALSNEFDSLQFRVNELQSCIRRADTLDEAQDCRL